MYTNPSNPYNEDGDSNHGATMKQNGIFETQLRAWMNALSPEGRAAALSVKDNAFLFTLMHFASLSSSCGNCSDGTVAGIDGECTIHRESLYSFDFRVCPRSAHTPSTSTCTSSSCVVLECVLLVFRFGAIRA